MASWLQNLFKKQAKAPKDALGDRGENMAARYLRNQGYKIIMRNFRCDAGEVDIIARQRDMLVFVEVKTRAYDDPTPEEQVDPVKQQQIQKAAKLYLSRYGVPQPPARLICPASFCAVTIDPVPATMTTPGRPSVAPKQAV